MTDFNAIARDLDLVDLIMAVGNKKAKAAARKQRKACFNAIRDANLEDGSEYMSDEELLAELGV